MNTKDIFSNNVSIQVAPYTCGPVALLNALHLKGDFSQTEDSLAAICKAKLGIGTTNENLVKAAKEVGFEIVETKSEANVGDIKRNLDAGAKVIICYTNAYSGNGHYTLVTDYDNRALYCRDSAFGLFRFSKEYLGKFWHGSRDASKGSRQWYLALK